VVRPVRDRIDQNSPSLRNDDVVEGRMSLAESREPDLDYHCAGCTSAVLERILKQAADGSPENGRSSAFFSTFKGAASGVVLTYVRKQQRRRP